MLKWERVRLHRGASMKKRELRKRITELEFENSTMRGVVDCATSVMDELKQLREGMKAVAGTRIDNNELRASMRRVASEFGALISSDDWEVMTPNTAALVVDQLANWIREKCKEEDLLRQHIEVTRPIVETVCAYQDAINAKHRDDTAEPCDACKLRNEAYVAMLDAVDKYRGHGNA